jgi:regulator of protease activity HflC (stomatin/prohibitin superfamily)
MSDQVIVPWFLALALLGILLCWLLGVVIRLGEGETVVLAHPFGLPARILCAGINCRLPFLEQPVQVQWSEARLLDGCVTRRFTTQWRLSIKPRCYELPAIRCFTKDDVAITLGIVAHFQIRDVLLVISKGDLLHELHQRLEKALRRAVRNTNAHTLLGNLECIDQHVYGLMKEAVAELGLSMGECQATGLLLPVELENRLQKLEEEREEKRRRSDRLEEEARALKAFKKAVEEAELTEEVAIKYLALKK